MLVKNKYRKWYFCIINKAKKLGRVKFKNQYFENHHIIPDSFGGSNYKKNLVLLTSREHFICHLLLTKCTKGKLYIKAHSAFNIMRAHSKNRYQNFKSFEKSRINFLDSLKDSGHQRGRQNSNFRMSWINFPQLKVQLKISIVDLDNYLEQGWVLGRNLSYQSVTKIRKKFYTTLKISEIKTNQKRKSYNKFLNMYKLFINFNDNWQNFCKYHQIIRSAACHNIYQRLDIKTLVKNNVYCELPQPFNPNYSKNKYQGKQ